MPQQIFGNSEGAIRYRYDALPYDPHVWYTPVLGYSTGRVVWEAVSAEEPQTLCIGKDAWGDVCIFYSVSVWAPSTVLAISRASGKLLEYVRLESKPVEGR